MIFITSDRLAVQQVEAEKHLVMVSTFFANTLQYPLNCKKYNPSTSFESFLNNSSRILCSGPVDFKPLCIFPEEEHSNKVWIYLLKWDDDMMKSLITVKQGSLDLFAQ